MIRYILILILAILLGISSYLLYKNEYVVINIETGSRDFNTAIVQGGKIDSNNPADSQDGSSEIAIKPKSTLAPDISDEIEELEEDSGIEVHLDPTVGVDINEEQRIASSYRVIGPRQFVLLTDKEKPMVEIDLETGEVKIGPDYELDEVSTEFWNSIGKKYPEICFVEKN